MSEAQNTLFPPSPPKNATQQHLSSAPLCLLVSSSSSPVVNAVFLSHIHEPKTFPPVSGRLFAPVPAAAVFPRRCADAARLHPAATPPPPLRHRLPHRALPIGCFHRAQLRSPRNLTGRTITASTGSRGGSATAGCHFLTH